MIRISGHYTLTLSLSAMKKYIYTKESELLRNWLIKKRHDAALSQRQLASLLKTYQSVVGNIETGERQINVIELIEYCEALDVDPFEIIEQLKLRMKKQK